MPLCNAEYLRNGTRQRYSYNGILIGTYTCPTQGCHFEWPWVTLSDFDLEKYSMTRTIARPLCDSWASCYTFAAHVSRCPDVRVSTSAFFISFAVCTNTEQSSMLFGGGNHHHQKQVLITIWAKFERGQGSRIRHKIRIDVKTVQPRPCSDWLDIISQYIQRQMRLPTWFQVKLNISIINFM